MVVSLINILFFVLMCVQLREKDKTISFLERKVGRWLTAKPGLVTSLLTPSGAQEIMVISAYCLDLFTLTSDNDWVAVGGGGERFQGTDRAAQGQGQPTAVRGKVAAEHKAVRTIVVISSLTHNSLCLCFRTVV